MRNLTGRVAAATGAASGIGRALALALAAEGCELALSDVDEAGLEETRRLAEARGAKVSTAHVDVADQVAVEAWAEQVVRAHGAAHLIFNNAGVALAGTISNLTVEELEWLMRINFWGVVYGTKAFLPHLERAGEGHIVNISSAFGLIAVPGNGAYNAAKFGVRGFTECLSMELEAARSAVAVTSVHPGGIRMQIARNARLASLQTDGMTSDERHDTFTKVARTTAETAARRIVDGVKRGKRRVLIGSDARVLSGFQRVFPTLYQTALARISRRWESGRV
ncbi:MAG: SDR family NAD(P)-dependent oxidoreductase [bacterium]|nr:SDR family NAD(P)-dependent oxidoreductase [bacterium]